MWFWNTCRWSTQQIGPSITSMPLHLFFFSCLKSCTPWSYHEPCHYHWRQFLQCLNFIHPTLTSSPLNFKVSPSIILTLIILSLHQDFWSILSIAFYHFLMFSHHFLLSVSSTVICLIIRPLLYYTTLTKS